MSRIECKYCLISRGFIKGQAPGKLTSCEQDLAITLPGYFHLLFLLSFIRKAKNARLKNPTDLLLKNLMKPLNKYFIFVNLRLFDIFILLHIWQNCVCFGDFLPMRTPHDAYHKEFESQRSIVDISDKKEPWNVQRVVIKWQFHFNCFFINLSIVAMQYW